MKRESSGIAHEIFMRNAELFSDARVHATFLSYDDDDAKTSSRNSSERRKENFKIGMLHLTL